MLFRWPMNSSSVRWRNCSRTVQHASSAAGRKESIKTCCASVIPFTVCPFVVVAVASHTCRVVVKWLSSRSGTAESVTTRCPYGLVDPDPLSPVTSLCSVRPGAIPTLAPGFIVSPPRTSRGLSVHDSTCQHRYLDPHGTARLTILLSEPVVRRMPDLGSVKRKCPLHTVSYPSGVSPGGPAVKLLGRTLPDLSRTCQVPVKDG